MSDTAKFKDPVWAEQVTPEVTAATRAASSDGRITCAALRRVAEDSGVPYQVAGAAADAAGLKVGDCDLGCF